MSHHLFKRKPLSLVHEEMKGDNRLRRVLGPWSLTSLGIGCIIGAGIFVIIGHAAPKAGPALVLSFIAAGMACCRRASSARSIPVSAHPGNRRSSPALSSRLWPRSSP